MWRNLSVPRSRDSKGFRYPLIVQMLKKDLPKTCITLFIDWENSLQFFWPLLWSHLHPHLKMKHFQVGSMLVFPKCNNNTKTTYLNVAGGFNAAVQIIHAVNQTSIQNRTWMMASVFMFETSNMTVVTSQGTCCWFLNSHTKYTLTQRVIKSNFSSQYQSIIKQMGDKNTENSQLRDIAWCVTKFSNLSLKELYVCQ